MYHKHWYNRAGSRQIPKMLALHERLAAYRAAERPQQPELFDEAAFRSGRYTDGALLQFRGIVRDVQDPELVVLAPHTEDLAMGIVDEQLSEKLVERIPLKVALVPHTTDWASEAYRPKKPAAAADQARASGEPVAAKGVKRSNEDLDVEMEATAQEDKAAEDAASLKKAKAEAAEPVAAASQLIGSSAQTMSIFVYDGQYKGISMDAFKVNEAFDFIGILDLMVLGAGGSAKAKDGELSVQEMEELAISECFEGIQRRERSGAVLHCCDVTHLDNLHYIKPHESGAFYQKLTETNADRIALCVDEWKALGLEPEIAGMRQRLVEYLASVLLGDLVAAEYLLLCLLSRVYTRADPSTPLGNLSLNLVIGNALEEADEIDAFTDKLEATIRSLVPMVTCVDLSLQTLNDTKFMPHKDYENEVLLGGVLQVAHGTAMLVKETSLSAGQLSEQGTKNVGALQSLVDKMLLPYDFHYYSMDFPQDVAVITISEGKSILPVTAVVPLVATSTANGDKEPHVALPSEALLHCFRMFLGVLRSLTVSIGNEQAELAEQHYVACRKAQQNVSVRRFANRSLS